jgi:hypothetical protein
MHLDSVKGRKSKMTGPVAVIQGVSKIHGITSGFSSSQVDNKDSLYQPQSENV